MKKSQKQKTPNTIKQENQNKENPSQTFNTQLNFLMENELNAIGKLPKDLADRIEAIVIKLRDKPLIFIYLRSFLLI
ncbi:hypothetical protein PQ420_000941 [Campylobacter coli]|nr:hypothetical protein [Campylobacter coli]EAJ7201501.1 hypothetical protein [Campylobacter coli]EAJ9449252.1 hypothetical protein [Campylobacter coli]EJV0578496.1 hypothetical protein [Campylobacter coli]EKF0534255.1 hypothetical protein [Campylobacter coli]